MLQAVAVSATMLKKTWATGAGTYGAKIMFHQRKLAASCAGTSASALLGPGESTATSGAVALAS